MKGTSKVPNPRLSEKFGNETVTELDGLFPSAMPLDLGFTLLFHNAKFQQHSALTVRVMHSTDKPTLTQTEITITPTYAYRQGLITPCRLLICIQTRAAMSDFAVTYFKQSFFTGE